MYPYKCRCMSYRCKGLKIMCFSSSPNVFCFSLSLHNSFIVHVFIMSFIYLVINAHVLLSSRNACSSVIIPTVSCRLQQNLNTVCVTFSCVFFCILIPDRPVLNEFFINWNDDSCVRPSLPQVGVDNLDKSLLCLSASHLLVHRCDCRKSHTAIEWQVIICHCW